MSLFVPPYKKLMQSRNGEIDTMQQQKVRSKKQSFCWRAKTRGGPAQNRREYGNDCSRFALIDEGGETIFSLENARAKAKRRSLPRDK